MVNRYGNVRDAKKELLEDRRQGKKNATRAERSKRGAEKRFVRT
jgi:hypothetical protein